MSSEGKIYIIGIGPGGIDNQTRRATEALAASEAVVGYHKYLELISVQLEGKELYSSGMMKEQERCEKTISLAGEGKVVSIVSSGDAGVYGMAGIVLELLEPLSLRTPVEVIPGVSSSLASAALLGAPLMHDYAVISLSDLMTSWELIRKRITSASEADFVITLYNPKSKKRVTQIQEAAEIMLEHKSPRTPVGIVRNACREGESVVVTTLGEMLSHPIDMFTTVIIGNSQTKVLGDWMVTPRGYRL